MRSAAILLLAFHLSGFPALAQDDDLDLDAPSDSAPGSGQSDGQQGGQSTEQFDDLEKELTESESSAPESTPSANDDLELDLDDETETAEEKPPVEKTEEKAQQEPPPPLEEPKKEEEVAQPSPLDEIPPSETPKQEEQVAEPSPIEETPFASDDTPDEDFEARLSRIYKEFYNTRTSDAEWVQIVGPKATEKYVIQNGDTLWGVSQTFFGNGFFWPKLWQLNSEFTNPHVLEVGDNIHFSPGGVSVEPTVNLTQSSNKFNEPEPPKAMVTPEQAKAYMANVQMPPALPTRPVIQVPPSLPLVEKSNKGYDKTGFSIKQVKRFSISDMSFVNYSVAESQPINIGKVVEAETGDTVINLYEEAVLELESAKEGDRLYTFRVGDRITNEFGTGYPIEYQGELEILENLGNNKFRALCLEAINPVTVGSLIRQGRLPKANFGKDGSPGRTSVPIFGGHYDSDRRNLGLGNLVYIGGGKSVGIVDGQLLTVLKNFKLRNPSTNMTDPAEAIGLLKVVSAAENVATAVVLEAREDLRPGDVTGPGDQY